MDVVIYTDWEFINKSTTALQDVMMGIKVIGNLPNKSVAGDRLYLATEDMIIGSFEIRSISESKIHFITNTWQEIGQEISVTPFSGYKYKWW